MVDGVAEMPDWQQRIVSERAELGAKLDKLRAFIATNSAFDGLRAEEKQLMIEQMVAMDSYLDVLDRRIALFT